LYYQQPRGERRAPDKETIHPNLSQEIQVLTQWAGRGGKGKNKGRNKEVNCNKTKNGGEHTGKSSLHCPWIRTQATFKGERETQYRDPDGGRVRRGTMVKGG